jgi:TRAP-type C4-dicarboxylate transport system substrate-binding protein
MTFSLTRRTLGASLLAAPFIRAAHAEEPLRLRATLDTSPTHGRNVAVTEYLQQLEVASKGRIVGQVFHSGQLYPDRDVSKALAQGQVEMAAPGTWLVTGFVPDADMLGLPAFYGQPLEVSRKVVDGKSGQLVAKQLNQKLKVQVLGDWFYLTFQNWYTNNRPLNSLADLKGLKIRTAGGFVQAWRTSFFGAVPNTTAWPDVPLALSQGTFDGVMTTNESIVSAKLWEAGLKYGLEDHQAMAMYIPMISGTFWAKLTPDLQKLMRDLWAENSPVWRKRMVAAAVTSREEMIKNGVKLVTPAASELADARKRQLLEQDKVAQQMKISPELLKQITLDIGDA